MRALSSFAASAAVVLLVGLLSGCAPASTSRCEPGPLDVTPQMASPGQDVRVVGRVALCERSPQHRTYTLEVFGPGIRTHLLTSQTVTPLPTGWFTAHFVIPPALGPGTVTVAITDGTDRGCADTDGCSTRTAAIAVF